ncbi:MAG: transcriptional repressor [Oscillospiraceae bacterium]|jgi:Fur family peroxide stress response transcriptional regulator|nr:transcriptional repressor [Oscillospiraceae bacterium]
MTSLQKSTLSLIKGSRGHFTAEDVLAGLRSEYPTVSIATVYRNLDIFTREGQIKKITVADSKSIYDGNLLPHEHTICVKCGKISDFPAPNLIDIIADSIAGEVVSFDLIVQNICAECQPAAKNPQS